MVIEIFVVTTVDVIVIDFCIAAWLDIDVALTCLDWLIYWLMMLDSPGLPVSDWPGTGVSGRRLSAYFRHQHALTPIDRHSDVHRPTFK